MTESREPSYAYPEDDLDYRDRYALARRGDPRGADVVDAPEPPGAFPGAGPPGGPVPYPEDEGLFPGGRSMYDYEDRRSSRYDDQPPPSPGAGADAGAGAGDRYYRHHRHRVSEDARMRPDEPPRESRRHRKSRDEGPPLTEEEEDKLKFLPAKYARPNSRLSDNRESDRDSDREARRNQRYLGENDVHGRDDDDNRAHKRSSRARSPRPESPPSKYKYAEPNPYEYGRVDDRSSRYGPGPDRREEDDLTYGADPYGGRERPERPEKRDRRDRRDASPNPAARYSRRDASPGGPEYPPRPEQYYGGSDPRESANTLTVEPAAGRRSSSRRRDRSPQPPTQGMSNLTVNTAVPAGATLAAAPGSPMLEAYRGTYQDMSPMPSPLLTASNAGPLVTTAEPLSPIASDDERAGRRRRARFHDSGDVAERLASALKGNKRDSDPDTVPLIEILPGLSHEQVMELRKEYKALVKTGADRKGVNVAKHIRSRLKDSDPNLMKACYAVALGRWESEAYWANFWYQGDKTRRELLIESLMGRTNEEIREIKDSFSDRKYDNSLTKCMKEELKEDKFKKAVLMVLDERRMDDVDPYGRPLPLDYRLVDRDVDDLRAAVKSERGGESAMISIVVQRSDAHLREVLKTYEKDFRANFARDALKKSGNLVGEVLAHILNGVINKPVRDALLLNHALTASRRDDLRRELLISRLVRYHWDGKYMEAVRRAYRERYGVDLKEAVREATSGEWGHFCFELCIHRMPDDVKQYERVEVIR